MYLTVHAAAGGAVALQTGNPILGFGVGFISHLLLDVIPHGDSEKSGMPQNNTAILIAASIDIAVLSVIVATLVATKGVTIFTPVLIAGAVGGMVPDALQLPYLLSHGRYFKWYQKIHNFFHNAIVLKWDMPYPLGIALQLSLAIGIILLLF